MNKLTSILASALVLASVVLPFAPAVQAAPAAPAAATAPTAVATPNLIANPSLETPTPTEPTTPQGWFKGGWGTNTAAFAYPVAGQSGANAAQVQISRYTDGDAKWYFAPVAVQAGGNYYFSDYYKSTVGTEVVAEITNVDGTTSYQYLGALSPAANWTSQQIAFTAPTTAKTITIFHLLNQIGTLQVDNFSLQAQPPVVPFDSGILPNGSVEQAAPGNAAMPQSWQSGSWGTNTTSFSYLNTGRTGSHSLKVTMNSYTDGDAKWLVTPQAVQPNQSYTFSDYFQSNVNTTVYAMITDTAGYTSYQYLGGAAPSAGWHLFSSQFTTSATAATISILHVIGAKGYLVTDDYSLKAYAPIGFNRGIVSLTFDDGWESQYLNGLPVLQQYRMPATFYLVSGFLNTYSYMTTAEAKAMRAAGNELGSHTINHLDLTTLNASQLNQETATARTRLQRLLGGSFPNFASPYGAYNDTVIAKLRRVYGSHRTVTPGYNSKNGFDRYAIKVQNITDTTTLADVQGWIDYAKTHNVWLVLVYHQVDVVSTGGEYNTTPTQLSSQLQTIQQSGMVVETVAQALAELSPQLP